MHLFILGLAVDPFLQSRCHDGEDRPLTFPGRGLDSVTPYYKRVALFLINSRMSRLSELFYLVDAGDSIFSGFDFLELSFLPSTLIGDSAPEPARPCLLIRFPSPPPPLPCFPDNNWVPTAAASCQLELTLGTSLPMQIFPAFRGVAFGFDWPRTIIITQKSLTQWVNPVISHSGYYKDGVRNSYPPPQSLEIFVLSEDNIII